MKKTLIALLTCACMALTAVGCGSADDERSSDKTDSASSAAQTQAEAPETEKDGPVQTAAPEKATEEAPETTAEELSAETDASKWDWSAIPEMADITYIKINGETVTNGYFQYTSEPQYGDYFMAGFTYNDSTYVFGAVVPTAKVESGMALNGSDLTTSDSFIYYMRIGNDLSMEELMSNTSSSFSGADMHFGLYDYYPNESAAFYVKADVPASGGSVTIEMFGSSYYVGNDTGADEGTSIDTGAAAGSDVCIYCDGTGQCHICRGAGATKTGMPFYGDPDLDDYAYLCNGCNGTGECSYCYGTGIAL